MFFPQLCPARQETWIWEVLKWKPSDEWEKFGVRGFRASWYHLHQQEFKTHNVSLVRTNKPMESPGWAQPHCKQGKQTAGACRNGRRELQWGWRQDGEPALRGCPWHPVQYVWLRRHGELFSSWHSICQQHGGPAGWRRYLLLTCQVWVNTCILFEMVPTSPCHGKVVHNMGYAEWQQLAAA